MSRSGEPGVSASTDEIQRITNESDQTLAGVSKIFRDALDSFVKNLSQTEKKDFSEHKDAQSVIDAFQTITEKHPIHHSRLTNASRKFQHLVNRLQPYFDVIDTFIQAKPEYMALVWGSLKMIFKVSLRSTANNLVIYLFIYSSAQTMSTSWIKWLIYSVIFLSNYLYTKSTCPSSASKQQSEVKHIRVWREPWATCMRIFLDFAIALTRSLQNRHRVCST